MDTLRFGTAGIPISAQGRDSNSGILRVHELGLGCMEVEFVRGIKMGNRTAEALGRTAKEQDVVLSVHAPYYINLNSRDGEKVSASRKRIIDSSRLGAAMCARNVVFHPGFYHSDPIGTVYGIIKTHLMEITDQLHVEGIDIILRPETTGRTSQFGTLTEILELSNEVESVLPCIDFSHLHAREGKLNSYPEFCSILDAVESHLGREGLDDMHIHISGIGYGRSGEKHHLILEESDMDTAGLIRAMKDYDIKGTLICESPNIEGDALLLQGLYSKL